MNFLQRLAHKWLGYEYVEMTYLKRHRWGRITEERAVLIADCPANRSRPTVYWEGKEYVLRKDGRVGAYHHVGSWFPLTSEVARYYSK